MKNRLLILTRILLKNGNGLTTPNARKNKSQKLIFLFLAICFLPLAFSIGTLVSHVYDAASVLRQQGIILSLGASICSFMIFFFGIFYVMNTYYFSKDVENFLPLPLKPSHILGAKFLVTVVYEYLTELLILGPVLIVYGIKSSAGLTYYVWALLIFLLLPVIPLIMSSLIVMIIMCFTRIGVNKDRIRVIGAIVALAIGLGINFVFQRFAQSSMNPEKLVELLQKGENSLIGLTSKIFPGSYFAATGLASSSSAQGLLNIGIFAAITFIATAIFLLIGEKLYFKGAIGISEASAKRKAVSSAELAKVTVQSSSMKSLIVKEIRILLRTPIYFINCILINFLWPVFLALPLVAQSGGNSSMEQIFQVIQSADDALIFAIGIGFLAFASSSNAVSSSAITREGQNLYIAKYIPVSYKHQIMAKAFTGTIVSSINLVILALVLLFVVKASLVVLLMVVLAGILSILSVSFGGIIIDLFNPKLTWDTEQKVVKQNINVMISMLIGLIICGLTIFIQAFFELNLVPAFLLISGVLGLICFGLYKFISTKGVKLYERIEG